ncbi:hypothetical protein A2U01_0069376, partial [Trifolium medium]|nr:hypothetical protein [Trifolium medium]
MQQNMFYTSRLRPAQTCPRPAQGTAQTPTLFPSFAPGATTSAPSAR